MRALLIVAIAFVLVVAAVFAAEGTNRDKWADTPTTTNLWKVISGGDLEELKQILETNPEYASVRASDGRGPLWWAHEYGKEEIIAELIKNGASYDERDADGKNAKEITAVGPTAHQQEQEKLFAQQQQSEETPKSGFEDDDDDV